MTNLSFSKWLLPAGNSASAILPNGDDKARKRETFYPSELSRWLSRWENEGGALRENQTSS